MLRKYKYLLLISVQFRRALFHFYCPCTRPSDAVVQCYASGLASCRFPHCKISSLELQIGSRFCLHNLNPIVHLSTVCTAQSMCFVNGYEIQRAMARRAEDSTCFFIIIFPQYFNITFALISMLRLETETIPA